MTLVLTRMKSFPSESMSNHRVSEACKTGRVHLRFLNVLKEYGSV